MRQFKFIGNPDAYLWDEKPVFGQIYPGTHIGTVKSNNWFSEPLQTCTDGSLSRDWQEIFDSPLHKDTDLGYFAGLAMQSCIREWSSDHKERLIKESISLAKELIKQLDNEKTKS